MPILESRGQSLYFEDHGSGPCVVLGHSFLCDGTMWAYQVPRLAASHRVLNLDLRGHGRSGEIQGPSTISDLVDDVVAVLDHAGVKRAVWVGLSIGGLVAMRAALTCPDRVSGLILLDTDAGRETALRKIKYRTMAVGARWFGLRALLPAVTPLMFGVTTRRQKPDLVHRWCESFAGIRVATILNVLGALLGRESMLGRLAEIRVPALVVVGEEDRALPPRLSREIATRLADAELLTIPQAGHLSALEQPEIVTGAMLEFLSRRA